ncbi:hypothetical protein C8R44DRAFT_952096 [Mycena epipterygia]|nr:hypothetical protein C8R44DRAFT_952096 [Mycena epipterygia]
MALYLTLLTHLCVHVLGLTGNPVLTLIFSGLALIVYWLYLVLLPALWPGRILNDMLTRIEAMQKYLHEEAARRRTLEMYDLSTYGLSGLEELKRIRKAFFDDYCFHLAAPLLYAHVGLSLCKRAQRCKRDVEALCLELDVIIQRFDNPDAQGDEETPFRGRTWFDAVLTALIVWFDSLLSAKIITDLPHLVPGRQRHGGRDSGSSKYLHNHHSIFVLVL